MYFHLDFVYKYALAVHKMPEIQENSGIINVYIIIDKRTEDRAA